ncbi:MAG: ATP-binding cassette domain-containing protein [Brachymonas sp.]|nr:ATP-binding cassette domain-containing protein [Brachymonas sp.]
MATMPAPTTATASTAPAAPPLLQVREVHRHYRAPRLLDWPAFGHRSASKTDSNQGAAAEGIHALKGISFTLRSGQSLGIVGESGSGKSTLARLIMALDAPDSGSIHFKGQNLHTLPAKDLRTLRPQFQMVFQDPYGSLDPRQRIGRIVSEPLHQSGLDAPTQQARAAEALQAVGLQASDLAAYPHEFSGGQRQRIAIARALVSRPQLIVADEPVSALDVSVQAQVLNLLQSLQTQGISLILISHDLAVVQYLCEQVCVLYRGEMVEYGPTEQVLQQPQHPYTRQLLAASQHAFI